MIKIVLNPEYDGSFLMKSIKMKFHGHSGIGSCLRDRCSLYHIQVTQDLQDCCTSA